MYCRIIYSILIFSVPYGSQVKHVTYSWQSFSRIFLRKTVRFLKELERIMWDSWKNHARFLKESCEVLERIMRGSWKNHARFLKESCENLERIMRDSWKDHARFLKESCKKCSKIMQDSWKILNKILSKILQDISSRVQQLTHTTIDLYPLWCNMM